METPSLPKYIFGEDFNHVYEPSEDTFLLLDAIEIEIDYIRKHSSICLEVGSGSGAVITSLSNALEAKGIPKFLIATDINPRACRVTQKCANHNRQRNVEVVLTDLTGALVDRLQNQVDLIIFNPPYVPTEKHELIADLHNQINLSWAGGELGRELSERFLEQNVRPLLSKPYGIAFMVVLAQNDKNHLSNYLISKGIRGTVIKERVTGIEHLYVIKYEWMEGKVG